MHVHTLHCESIKRKQAASVQFTDWNFTLIRVNTETGAEDKTAQRNRSHLCSAFRARSRPDKMDARQLEREQPTY